MAALQMSLQNKRDAEEGVQWRDIAFPKGGKGALFDIQEIFEILKKIIKCSLHEAKITNYEPNTVDAVEVLIKYCINSFISSS